MPRYTAAYSGFILRLKEVETIWRTARYASEQPLTPSNIELINALCRSGVVLLSSHIEGYVEDLGQIALDRIESLQLPKKRLGPQFRYYLSRDLINEIRQTTNPAQVASKVDQLFVRDGHIWSSDPTFTNSLPANIFLADFSNPKNERITKFFKRFGYEEYTRDLRRRLKADFNACANMIDHVVDQRNRIAHGDMVTTETPSDLANMIQLVKQYCRETDHVVGNWFRSQNCVIR